MVNNKHLLETMSKELAYWIGYIAADGGIKKDNSKLSFCIKDTDKILLEKLSDYFGVTNPIKDRSIFDKRTGNTYHQVTLQICDTIFTKALSQYNLTNTKSKDFIIPDTILNGKYFFNFLRGLIDGDGSISIIDISPRVGILSTKTAIFQIQDYLEKNYGFKPGFVTSKSKNINFEAEQISYYKDAVELLNLVYADGYILERKYQKYLQAITANSLKVKNKGSIRITRGVDIYENNILILSTKDLGEAASFLGLAKCTISNIISGANPCTKYKVVPGKYYKHKTLRNGEYTITEYPKENS